MTSALIRRLRPDEAADYRRLMLEAYAGEPDAFTSTVGEREGLPLDWWAARIGDGPNPKEVVFGAFQASRLVGLAGLMREVRERTGHKATLFGMYVTPADRGQGIARGLVRQVLAHAHGLPGLRVVQLTVTESNAAAVRLYAACGFVPFGVEPMAVQVGGRFVSKVHMGCRVGADAG